MGLLNKIVPSDQLLDAAIEMGRQIAANTPEMVQGIKQILLADSAKTGGRCTTPRRKVLTTTHIPPPIAEGFKDFLSRKGRR